MNGAEIIVKSLAEYGVSHVFGLVGTTTLEILDALHRDPRITYISVRHEQVAASMADGYARVTGKHGVCLVHSGPGAANLTLGVAAAYKDSSPVVALTGNEPTFKLGRDCWHELDHLALFRPITKLALQARNIEELPRVLQAGLGAALQGRPGPVHIDLPRNVCQAQATTQMISSPSPLAAPRPDSEAIRQTAALLLKAQRPLVISGGGVAWSGAWKELRSLVEKTALPVVLTHTSRGVLSEDHPLAFGVVGSFGIATANQALKEADLVLAVGCSLSDITTLDWTLISPEAKIVQADIDPGRIGRHYLVEVGIVADARAFFTALEKEVEEQVKQEDREPFGESARLRELRKLFQAEQEKFFEAAASEAIPLKPQRIIRELDGLLAEDAIVAVGGGLHTLFGSRVLVRTPRSYLNSVGLGAMGFAFPAAMGAKLAYPKRSTIALVGDGDFGMVLQDLETAVRYNIPVTVVVFNNLSYGALKVMQHHAFDRRYIGVDFQNPDFTQLAQIFG
ncbi:MAG: thiamine pyrophosphate-binding protein, partial [Candidatus Binatia bacterium]|nr:thiamine pyrophosphate-binding protein [Candidatus Binatia bacterium]